MARLPEFREEQEYRILRESAASYAANELAPQAEELDLEPAAWRVKKAISKAGELGMLSALVPEEKGGGGLDDYAFCVALEEIAVEEAGIAVALLAHNAALLPSALGEFEGLITGVGAESYPACLAFPGEISLRDGKVSGKVPFAFNAVDCPFITLIPTDEAGTRAATVSADATGVSAEPEAYPLGLRAACPGSLRLEGAEPSNLISGGNMLEAVERALYLGLAAVSVGIIRNSLRKAYAYARERYQAGKMIIEHQQMRLFLAEMLAGVEEGRSLVREASSSPELAPSMIAWLRNTARACQAATDGVQIHGGYGYMRDYGMERLMRDAKYCQMYPSTSQEALLRLLDMSETG
ncbi:MAG: acyl-CoA/acyl-ACP dehydrogenase [Actinobacteria bacterium]|nr:acyl-CoA/acyl-ACP dehydrogenase [Actinomycetota bacterium]